MQTSSDRKEESLLTPISDPPQPISTSVDAAPPKVDYATDLFSMLSVNEHSENALESSPTDDNSWAGFQCKYCIHMME